MERGCFAMTKHFFGFEHFMEYQQRQAYKFEQHKFKLVLKLELKEHLKK